MVKVFGPALSLDASGTIGNAITFSKWKGRHYIRERIIPANPKSALQISMRSSFAFLSQRWNALTTVQKQSWDSLGDSIAVSPFNAYMQHNQRRWRSFRSPTKLYPAGEANTLGTPHATPMTATGGVASITVTVQLATANDNWGAILFRSTSPGFDKVISAVHQLLLVDGTDLVSWVDSPLAAGTYYYSAFLFTDDGLKGGAIAEVSAAAT